MNPSVNERFDPNRPSTRKDVGFATWPIGAINYEEKEGNTRDTF